MYHYIMFSGKRTRHRETFSNTTCAITFSPFMLVSSIKIDHPRNDRSIQGLPCPKLIFVLFWSKLKGLAPCSSWRFELTATITVYLIDHSTTYTKYFLHFQTIHNNFTNFLVFMLCFVIVISKHSGFVILHSFSFFLFLSFSFYFCRSNASKTLLQNFHTLITFKTVCTNF